MWNDFDMFKTPACSAKTMHAPVTRGWTLMSGFTHIMLACVYHACRTKTTETKWVQRDKLLQFLEVILIKSSFFGGVLHRKLNKDI